MAGKDLLSIVDLKPGDIRWLVVNAVDMKSGGWMSYLGGKTPALVFEKRLLG